MARGVSEGFTTTLKAAQEASSNIPYICIYINGVDYSGRLLFIEHREEAYRDYATIILRNDDRTLDLATVDLTGRSLEVGYGQVTTSNEHCHTATLWVKSQQIISVEGQVACQLYCEGMWTYLREQRILLVGSAPYYTNEDAPYTTQTVYQLLKAVAEATPGMSGWTLSAFDGTKDGIINTFKPVFVINAMPYENAAEVLYRLIWMTKCYLRAKPSKTFELVFPQEADAVDHTYYSYQPHYWREYTEKLNETVPNRIVVFCNQAADGTWDALITGDTGAYSGNYVEVIEPFIAGSIATQGDANLRAAAILSKIKSESLAGRLIIPHDASVELYDKVAVWDARGY